MEMLKLAIVLLLAVPTVVVSAWAFGIGVLKLMECK